MSQTGSYFKFGVLVRGFDSIASSGSTTTLTTSSSPFQIVTGVSTHTVKMPNATLASVNRHFNVISKDTSVVTVQDFDGNTLGTVAAGAYGTFRLITAGTTAGVWDTSLSTAGGGSGSGVSVDNKINMIQGLPTINYNDGTNFSKKLPFNPEEVGGDFWTTHASMISARHNPACFDILGFGYAVGGNNSGSSDTNDNQKFNQDSNYWLSRATATTSKQYATGGYVDTFGFNIAGEVSSAASATNERYDSVANTWSSRTSMTVSRENLTSRAASTGGYIYLGGGANPGYTSTFERYDNTLNSWLTTTPLLTDRLGSGMMEILGNVYISGGEQSGTPYLTTVNKFNVSISVWETVSPLNTGKVYSPSVSGSVGGYSFGGVVSGSTSAVMETYVVDQNVWKSRAPVSYASRGPGAISPLGFMLSVGGASGVSIASTVSTVEKYTHVSFLNVVLNKKSENNPTLILASTAMSGLSFECPVQVRTDGNEWKTFVSNKDSILKQGDVLKNSLVRNGLVIITGGDNSSVANNVTEKYDEVAGVFTVRQPMGTVRVTGAGFATEGYGMVGGGDVFGSSSPSYTNTTERYNETTNTWANRTSFTVNRYMAFGSPINDVGYVVGGGPNNTPANIVGLNESYNNTTDAWTTKTSMTTGRNVFGLTCNQERNYAFGGQTSSGSDTNSTEAYNPTTNLWYSLANYVAAERAMAAFSIDGYVFAAGGSTHTASSRYNPTTNSWSSMATIPNTTYFACGLRLGSFGYAVGGGSSAGTDGLLSSKYNYFANAWTNSASLNTSRRYPTAVPAGSYRNYELRVGIPSFIAGLGASVWSTLASLNNTSSGGAMLNFNGEAVFVGGYNGSDTTNSQAYNKEYNIWVAKASVSAGRHFSTSFTLLSHGYVVSGGLATSSTGEKLDFNNNSWSSISGISSSRNTGSGASLNGYGYSMGGQSGGSAVGTNDQYNQAANSWTTKTSDGTTSANSYSGSFSAGGFVYRNNGVQSGGVTTTTANRQYNDVTNAWLTKAVVPQTMAITATFSYDNDKGYVAGGDSEGGSPTYYDTTFEYNHLNDTWSKKSPTPQSFSQARGTSVNGEGITAGGYNGSSYLSQACKLISSNNKMVLGIGLRIEE